MQIADKLNFGRFVFRSEEQVGAAPVAQNTLFVTNETICNQYFVTAISTQYNTPYP